MLLVALTVGCCWILLQLWGVLLVLVLALFLVGTLNPAVAWLEQRRMLRGFAIGAVFAILFSGITLSLVLTLPTLVEQVARHLNRHLATVSLGSVTASGSESVSARESPD